MAVVKVDGNWMDTETGEILPDAPEAAVVPCYGQQVERSAYPTLPPTPAAAEPTEAQWEAAVAGMCVSAEPVAPVAVASTPQPTREGVSAYDPLASGDMLRWIQLKAQLTEVKEQEMALRRRIVGFYAPQLLDGTEGTQSFAIDGGKVSCTGALNRSVDVATLATMREEFEANDIPVDTLVEWKPDLKVTAYKKLPDNLRVLFDKAITIKPGAPTLKFVESKKK